MSIKVNWLDTSQTIVRWDFEGTWTVEEYTEAAMATGRLTKDVPNYYVLTVGVERTPPHVITAILSVHRRAMPNFRFTVMVAPPNYVKSLGQIISELPPARSRFYFADTEAEALQIIARDRAKRATQEQVPPGAAQP